MPAPGFLQSTPHGEHDNDWTTLVGTSVGRKIHGCEVAVEARMRTLVISDIHGNWPALRAVVATQFDSVIALGDLVGYGPFPAECVAWVREHASIAVQGNHDCAYGADVAAGCRPDFRWLSDAVGPLTWSQLDARALHYLANIPRWAVLDIDRRKYAFVHAAPSDPLYEYIGPDPERWDVELDGLDVDVLVVGHTHLQFALTLGTREVVNPGSVGQPKDGDPRAAFMVIEDGEWRLERVAYPIEDTVNALSSADVDREAVSVLAELLRTGRIPDAAANSPQAKRYGSVEAPPPHADSHTLIDTRLDDGPGDTGSSDSSAT